MYSRLGPANSIAKGFPFDLRQRPRASQTFECQIAHQAIKAVFLAQADKETSSCLWLKQQLLQTGLIQLKDDSRHDLDI